MIFFGSFLFFFFLLRVWLAGFGGIHPDEAYYWAWSQYPSWGYFDHPPMIAWLIRAGDFVVQHFVPEGALKEYPAFFAQVGLRLFPYFLATFILPLIIARAIEVMQKRPLGLLQMVALLTAPAFVLGPQIVTPDLPLFVGWALCLLFNLRLLDKRGPEAVPGDDTPFSWKSSIFAGLALAFAAYSKHTAILAAFLFVVCGTGPYNSMLAGLTAFVFVLPHFLWYRTTGLGEGAGILFQLNNALGSDMSRLDYKRMGDLIATQLFIWSPVTFWLAIQLTLVDMRLFFLPRKVRRPTGTLFVWAFVPVIFFSLTALRRPAEANWPLTGILAALILVISKSFDRPRRLTFVVASNFLILIVTVMALFKPLDLAAFLENKIPHLSRQLKKPSRTRDFTGWDRFHTLVFEATRGNDFPIEVESYQLLSELMFFDSVFTNEQLGSRLKIWVDGSRKSQFNLWPNFIKDPVIGSYWLVAHGNRGVPKTCRQSQVIYRNLDDENYFQVLKCNF